MTSIRLLPLVAISAAALLILKTVGLMTHGAFALSGAAPATAEQSAHGEPAAAAPAISTTPPTEAPPRTDDGQPIAASRSEEMVLDQLGGRRQELEKRSADIDLREQLLEATERRVAARVEELKGLQAKVQNQAAEDDEARREELQNLIVMYEAMKPKDAARIFDRLDLDILVDLARNMKPKKMADIVGQMEPDAAQRLTVELATRGRKQKQAENAELPKIGEAPAAATR